MKVFIAGIGGSGLSSMAEFCLDYGMQVYGSDIQNNPKIEALQARGARIKITNDDKFLSQVQGLQAFVYSPSLKSDSPQRVWAFQNDIPSFTQNQFLNQILPNLNQLLVAVTGTHGKTTTSSMLVYLLQQLDQDVSFIIGTKLYNGRGGMYNQDAKLLVIESDEYAKKFLDLSPEYSLITNIDYDHADIYPTPEDYDKAFEKYVLQVQRGYWMWSEDYYRLRTNGSEHLANIFEYKEALGFLKKVKMSFVGEYNFYNAFLVSVFVYYLYRTKVLINFEQILYVDFMKKCIEILQDFPGTQRRQQKLTKNVYTDYAHHPKEIKSTIGYFRDLLALTKNSDIVDSKAINLKNKESKVD